MASSAPAPVTSRDRRSLQWLAMSLTPGLGAVRSKRLLEHFGNIENVFSASLTELEAAGIPAQSAQSLALGQSWALAEEELGKATAAGAQILTLDSEQYPQRLAEIYDPPLALYIRGNVAALERPQIAVVGTRHPTPYGMGMAERLSCDLAARGLAIISGMARGVDAHAHKGALNAKGCTIAVFGTGVDVPYPRENKKLAEAIVESGGALISEFSMGTTPFAQNFPIRNRIISGLSLGVLVIEAAEYSGTRITARCALEQSRDVFAVPGNVTNKQSWGPNTLIKQGAKLTATWDDVWEELSPEVKQRLESEAAAQAGSEPKPGAAASLFTDVQLSPHEKRVYSLIKPDEPVHIDEIVERLDPQVSPSEIFAALFELELAGKVRQLPGKNYVRSF